MANLISDTAAALKSVRGLTLLAITGGIASGKSTVCRQLEAAGHSIFYCDNEAKRIIRSHPQVREELTTLVGNDLYDAEGKLVKSVLAAYLCRGKECAKRVDAIVHPRVAEAWAASVMAHAAEQQAPCCPTTLSTKSLARQVTVEDLCQLPPASTLVMECALLFESGFDTLVDQSVLIHVSASTQLTRLMQRDNISEAKAREWMALQLPEEEKMRRATFILSND